MNFNWDLLTQMGGKQFSQCMDQPEVQACLPSSIRDPGYSGGTKCHVKDAFHATVPCLTSSLKCQNNWDGNTPGLNSLLSFIPIMNGSAPVKAFCSTMDKGVDLLSRSNAPNLELSDVLKFAKWSAQEVLPCAANSCYLAGSVSNPNPYPHLDPAHVTQFQNKIDGLIHWEQKLKTKLFWLCFFIVIISLLIGFLIGQWSKKCPTTTTKRNFS